MNFSSSQNKLLLGLLLSLAIHLLILTVVRPLQQTSRSEQPVYVEVLPEPTRREMVIPSQPHKQEVTSKRLAADNQQVIREQAPKGHEREDSSAPVRQPPAQPRQKTPQRQTPPQQKNNTTVVKSALGGELPKQQQKAVATKTPSLAQLMQSANSAAADIANEQRIKARPHVENGDQLLLNSRKDKLFSFFARFKRGVYMVWNYPEESIRKGQQGRTKLRIVINRDGSIEDVELLAGSGFERLDREAIAAIYKGEPYGKLPDDYPKKQLILDPVYFEYIYGSRIPNIYRGGKRKSHAASPRLF